jgi:putative ABC transport system permease protein
MMRVALRGLAGRKFRASLTALAIVLGVAMVSGTYVFTDTITKGFDTIFTESFENADAVVSGKDALSSSDESTSIGFSADVLAKVSALPEVEVAGGAIVDEATLIDKDGGAISSGDSSGVALSVDPDEQRFNPLTLAAGEWPRGAGQIAIDRATADTKDFALGDSIRVVAIGPAQRFRVTGIAEFGSLDSLGGATIAVFDVPTAQRLFHKQGKLDEIQVVAKPGVPTAELVRKIRPLLPPTAQVKSSDAHAEASTGAVSKELDILEYFLLTFGGIALFVGAFVIANTLAITVAQRTRELATLRTIGASRGQVLWSVVLEALVVGLLASVVGLFLGLGLASVLGALFDAAGISLPESGTVLAARTVAVSLAVGVGITLLASLRPALRATRVPPIAAVREGYVMPPSSLARYAPVAALAVTALGVAGLVHGVFVDQLSTTSRLASLGVGAVLLFLGVALIAPRLIRPLAFLLGWPATRIGGAAGTLARENARRNPGRTASTAAALMIGLALVTFVAVLGSGLRSSFSDAVDEIFVSDYALTAQGDFSPLTAAAAAAAEKAEGVEVVSGLRGGEGRAFGESVFVTGVEPDVTEILHVDWQEGSASVPADLGRTGAFVLDEYAEEHGLTVGSPLSLQTPTGKTLSLTVEGIVDQPKGGSPFGPISISTAAFDASYAQPRNDFTFVNMEGGVSAQNTASLQRALADFPDAQVQTRDQFKKSRLATMSRFLNVLYALLGLSVIVSLFGMVNTLVLTVFERTRELGMLRAVGMTRRQVRRMIRHEGIVTALIGAALGIGVGMFLALLTTQALSDEGIVFRVPYGSLLVFVLAAIAAGILAAVLPARRASRLNVLNALQYE